MALRVLCKLALSSASNKIRDRYFLLNLSGKTFKGPLNFTFDFSKSEIRFVSSFKTLFLNDDEKQLSFITKSFLNDDLELKNIRVLYFIENEQLYRREYKSINPADFNDYLDVLVLNEVTDIRISAHNKQRWLNVWPYDEVSKRKLPHAVSISITQRQEEVFEIILATHNDNVI